MKPFRFFKKLVLLLVFGLFVLDLTSMANTIGDLPISILEVKATVVYNNSTAHEIYGYVSNAAEQVSIFFNGNSVLGPCQELYPGITGMVDTVDGKSITHSVNFYFFNHLLTLIQYNNSFGGVESVGSNSFAHFATTYVSVSGRGNSIFADNASAALHSSGVTDGTDHFKSNKDALASNNVLNNLTAGNYIIWSVSDSSNSDFWDDRLFTILDKQHINTCDGISLAHEIISFIMGQNQGEYHACIGSDQGVSQIMGIVNSPILHKHVVDL